MRLSERFTSKYTVADNGCHMWHASISNGQGQYSIAGTPIGAHRYAFLMANMGLDHTRRLQHLCGNRACVNAEHIGYIPKAGDCRPGEPLTERFLCKVAKGDRGKCWEWTASLDPHGYGQFWNEGFMAKAHRVSWESANMRIPDGLVMDHLCRNRKCVNPEHLEPVTNAENIRRGNAGQYLKALQEAKTHCPAGHPYKGENLYTNTKGQRCCKVCGARRARESRARKKANK